MGVDPSFDEVLISSFYEVDPIRDVVEPPSFDQIDPSFDEGIDGEYIWWW